MTKGNNNLRAQTFNDFIGQDRIKNTLKAYIRSSKILGTPFPHVALGGPPGLGKTTLANIIAHSMNVPIYSYMGGTFETASDVGSLYREMYENEVKGAYNDDGSVKNPKLIKRPIIFIDEAHQLSKEVSEAFLMPAEDRLFINSELDVNGDNIRQWTVCHTLIFCTTEIGTILEPLRDRVKLHFNLRPYSEAEGAKIAENTAKKLDIKITRDACKDIAVRSGGTPRKILSAVSNCFETTIVEESKVIDKKITKIMYDGLGLDPLGFDPLTHDYIRVLEKFSPNAVGAKNIESMLNEKMELLEKTVESPLMRHGLMQKTGRGRKLTGRGLIYAKEYVGKAHATPEADKLIKKMMRAV